MLLCATTLAACMATEPAPDAPLEVPTLAVAWQVPDSCPGEAQLRRMVADFHEGFAARELVATGRIDRDGEAWVLSLQFDGQTKELRAATCDELTRAAALILSLASSPAEPEPTAESEPDPTPTTPTPTPASAPSPAASPVRLLQALVRADAGVGVGISPTLTTAALTTGVAWPRAQLELSGVLWAPADAVDRRGDGFRTVVTLGTVHARGCGVLRAGPVRFPLCGGLAMGAMRLADRSPTARQVEHRLWAGATAGAAAVWMFRPWAGLWVGTEGTLAAPTALVRLAQSDRTLSTGLVAIRGAVGLELHFPSRPRGRAGNTVR